MAFWSNFWGTASGTTPNANGPSSPPSVGGADYTPGDPDGFELAESTVETRALPRLLPSGWDGWPADWSVPDWDFGSRFNELVDIAWACLDLNARSLSTMPVYRTRGGLVIEPTSWMLNPDPSIYGSWVEFAKQLFWDYQLGEAFVLPMARGADGYPLNFRVIPPWLVEVKIRGGQRTYLLGGPGGDDVTDEILHIRYKSTTADAHGTGPLEVAGGRMLTAGVIAQYTRTVVSTGGIPHYTLETADSLNEEEALDLMNQWVASRAANLGAPPVLDNGVKLNATQGMSPKDMAMIEIAQFTEGRVADLLGVPRALVGLPQGDSMTYSNVSSWFDHHDRTTLRPAAVSVMSPLSAWALPRGQSAELNRDEYSRPSFTERADAFVKLVEAGIMTVDEVRTAERLLGERSAASAPPTLTALSGGT